jgi:hypothetical protein
MKNKGSPLRDLYRAAAKLDAQAKSDYLKK